MTKSKRKVSANGGGICSMCNEKPIGPGSVTKRCTNCNGALGRAERNGKGWRIRRKGKLLLFTSRVQLVIDRNKDE